ncbi:MAG TPA: hypothetical protein PKA41_13075 [Verrucomicrobiota bacterium]|nr:hypothetical protein [Verrucomicrobiota bacterium]
MDNERPIEKLLRRHAKQRREESGADVELHPATRKLLQGEVARQFPKATENKRPATGAFPALWTRLAYGVCAVAIVGVIGALVFPALNRAKSTAQFAKADYPAQAEAESLSRGIQPPAPATQPAAVVFNDGKASSRLEESDALPARRDKAVNEPQRKLDETPKETGLANGVVASAGTIQLAADDTTAQSADNQRPEIARFSNTGSVQTRASVLNSFQVEQLGDELRVIDEDGSTYSGNILVAGVRFQSAPPSGAGGGNDGGLGKHRDEIKKTEASKDSTASESRLQSDQNFYFRVAGFNNTLRQNVVFEGNLIPTNQAVQSSTGVTNLQQGQNQQFQNLQQFINNSVIIGRAQVEEEKEIEINATPVGP